jgi:hypothetical protein
MMFGDLSRLTAEEATALVRSEPGRIEQFPAGGTDRPELSDEQITAMIDDPVLIDDHETALEVLAVLDAEIAGIEVQLDAAMIEARARPLPADREAWFRRASYAGAMRRRERHKVYQRDKELRRLKGSALTPASEAKKLERAAKHQRLLAEAEDRKVKRALEHATVRLEQERLDMERTRKAVFFKVAHELLPPDMLQRINEAVAERATSRNPS